MSVFVCLCNTDGVNEELKFKTFLFKFIMKQRMAGFNSKEASTMRLSTQHFLCMMHGHSVRNHMVILWLSMMRTSGCCFGIRYEGWATFSSSIFVLHVSHSMYLCIICYFEYAFYIICWLTLVLGFFLCCRLKIRTMILSLVWQLIWMGLTSRFK